MVGRMKSAKGLAALELLLVAPLLIALFLGIVSLTLAVSLRADLAMVARAGMQHAMFDLDASENLVDVRAAAEAAATELAVTPEIDVIESCACMSLPDGELTPVDCSVTSCPAGDPLPHRYVRVSTSADYPFPWEVPGLPQIWQISAKAEVRTR